MKTIDYKLTNDILVTTTTRLEGFSKHPYKGLNLSYNVGDDNDLVSKNRELLPNQFINSTEKDGLLVEGEDDLILFTNDELPIVLLADKIYMFKLNKEDGLNLKLKDYLDLLIKKHNVDLKNAKVYLGPSLDFDECYLSKLELDLLHDKGYLSAAKGTDNKYTYDLKWHAYMIFKEYGIQNENFHYSTYQTNQYSDLFFSKTKEQITGKMATYVTRV